MVGKNFAFPENYRKKLTEKVLNLVDHDQWVLIEHLVGTGGTTYWRYIGQMVQQRFPKSVVINVDFSSGQPTEHDFIQYVDAKLHVNSAGNELVLQDHIEKFLNENPGTSIIFNINEGFDREDKLASLYIVSALRNYLGKRIIPIYHRTWRCEGYNSQVDREVLGVDWSSKSLYHGPMSKEELFATVEIEMNSTAEHNLKEKFFRISGGIVDIAKAGFMFYETSISNRSLDIDQIINEMMQNKIAFTVTDNMLDSLGQPCYTALWLVANGKKSSADDEVLKNLHYRDLLSDSHEIKSLFLQKILKSRSKKIIQHDSKFEGSIRDIGIESLNLTSTEERIFDLLLQKEDVVNRFEVAIAIWGDEATSRYSEYTIDKHISNLRKKLRASNTRLQIKTIHGRGFKMEYRK